jgi:hypothetical protein
VFLIVTSADYFTAMKCATRSILVTGRSNSVLPFFKLETIYNSRIKILSAGCRLEASGERHFKGLLPICDYIIPASILQGSIWNVRCL